MKKLLFLILIVTSTTTFAQAPIQLTYSCSPAPLYGYGTYTYDGMVNGKPSYVFYSNASGGDCSSLSSTQLACEGGQAGYYLIWEANKWNWKRVTSQCQWDTEFGQCVPGAVGNAIVAYLYSNTADTPFPPTTGWVVNTTPTAGYCEPIFATLSNASFLNSKLKIYPNPATTQSGVTIDLGGNFENVKIALHSVLGQLITENEYKTASTIKYAMNQPKGVYFFKIKIGAEFAIKKIVLN